MRVYQLIRVSGGRPTATIGHRTARRKRLDDLERIMRMVSSAIPIITFRYDPYKRKKLTFWVSLTGAEAAGFEPANRFRAVNCFRGSLLQPLGHASCYFIGTLSQALTLRAAFASSTYLLSQIPGPGRSSDDDLLNPPDPLFKGAHQGLRAFHRRMAFPARQLRPGI